MNGYFLSSARDWPKAKRPRIPGIVRLGLSGRGLENSAPTLSVFGPDLVHCFAQIGRVEPHQSGGEGNSKHDTGTTGQSCDYRAASAAFLLDDECEGRVPNEGTAGRCHGYVESPSGCAGDHAEIHGTRRAPAGRWIRHHYRVVSCCGEITRRQGNRNLRCAAVADRMRDGVVSHRRTGHESGAIDSQDLRLRTSRLFRWGQRRNRRHRIVRRCRDASTSSSAAARQGQHKGDHQGRQYPPPASIRRNADQASAQQRK